MNTHTLILSSVAVILAGVLGFLLFSAGVECQNSDTEVPSDVSNAGQTYAITYIDVLAGNEFDLKLENGKRIHAKLPVQTVPAAKAEVITYLNQYGDHPRVFILGKLGDTWIVDLFVRKDSFSLVEEEVSLTQWLIENKLVWEEL